MKKIMMAFLVYLLCLMPDVVKDWNWSGLSIKLFSTLGLPNEPFTLIAFGQFLDSTSVYFLVYPDPYKWHHLGQPFSTGCGIPHTLLSRLWNWALHGKWDIFDPNLSKMAGHMYFYPILILCKCRHGLRVLRVSLVTFSDSCVQCI